jgi:hypothetical protein
MWEYEIALSFAGEDRSYVKEVALCLKAEGIKVFYDGFEKVGLWGKNLYTHLSEVYSKRSRYTVVFLSENYKRKLWTRHELESAQARAFAESEEYLLPVRFDDTEIPGIQPTVSYIDLKGVTPAELAAMIKEKVRGLPTGIDEMTGFVYPPPFPWADVLFSEGNKSRHRSIASDGWRNHHQITYLVRPGRKVEVEVAKARCSEAADALTIALMFSGHRNTTVNYGEVLIEFISKYELDWISHEDVGRYRKWMIYGDSLVRHLPQLESMQWLKNKFQVPPLWHSGPRAGTGDPADSVGVEFTLFEPYAEAQKFTSNINFILNNYGYEDHDRLAEFLSDNEHKLEMLRGLVDCYKDYFGDDAVMKLRVRPHGDDSLPKRSLLVHVYTNNFEEGGRPVLDRFIEECVKNKLGEQGESPEVDRILFQARPLRQKDEVFPVYEKSSGGHGAGI